ncbi:MAG: MarR family transcriptional regulator [Caldilineaceae bacterium]
MKEFTELERDAWSGFISAWATMNRIVEEDLQVNAQITHVEFEIILRLHWAKEHRMRIQDLAKQSLLTRSGTSRALARLEKAGLVVREVADEDRRGAYAVLTKAGEQCFQKVAEPHMACVKANFTDRFSEEELKQMITFWQRL